MYHNSYLRKLWQLGFAMVSPQHTWTEQHWRKFRSAILLYIYIKLHFRTSFLASARYCHIILSDVNFNQNHCHVEDNYFTLLVTLISEIPIKKSWSICFLFVNLYQVWSETKPSSAFLQHLSIVCYLAAMY